MRLATVVAATVAALAIIAPRPARGADAVVAEPRSIEAGQSTVLRWYFSGRKVVVAGGRFGKGAVVTGKTRLTDSPKATTTYVFDVWYVPNAGPKPAEQATGKLVHARYKVTVAVRPSVAALLKAYRHTRGWSVRYLNTWKHDTVPLADPANNALVYFQQADDSVERLAVSILPARSLDTPALLRQVETSLPASYERVEVVSRTDTTHGGVPAACLTFAGGDTSHPGVRTQSVVLAFVHGAHAYVVSARTAASRFEARRKLLEKMVFSFVPGPVAVSRPPS